MGRWPYRRKGWPIGSEGRESAVKPFDKRVNGVEPFWSVRDVASTLSLRAPWLSLADLWTSYWDTRPAWRKAA